MIRKTKTKKKEFSRFGACGSGPISQKPVKIEKNMFNKLTDKIVLYQS